MAREFSESFYKTKAWQECRAGYIKSVGGLCEDCLERGIFRSGCIVHHIIHLTPDNIKDPSIALSWSNLKYVCRECHAQNHKSTPKRRYVIDEEGRVGITDAT